MGDREKSTLAKARKELEELYLGVPDESVNLTFQDLAQVKQNKPISPSPTFNKSPLTKIPSLDFSKAIESSFHDNYDHYQNSHKNRPGSIHLGHTSHDRSGFSHVDQQQSMGGYDDMSYMSGMSTVAYGTQQRGGIRRRPGIPHSNICALCCNYIYIFRHRCLVCGRVYCRQCVSIGMGEMTEGRKCVDCLGRKFSQRYIQKAGNVGCCTWYPSTVKQQELKWAEKGPRRSGENRYRNSVMMSRSRSPINVNRPPPTPKRTHSPTNYNPPSFVMSSTYSPTSHHPLPF